MAERGSILPLAVQLYTFRDPARFGGSGMGLDAATLREIADAGFLGVETVDVPGGDPAVARRVLDDLDLMVTSSHTWERWTDPDALRRGVDALAELGSPRVIVSPPAEELRTSLPELIDRLAAASEIAGERGLRLGIHNHDAEMAVVDGELAIDRLAAGLGGAADFQIDIFWAVVGHADPAAVIAGLAERVVSLHLKDGVALPSRDQADEPFVNVPVGSGVVDPGPAIAAATTAGAVEWLIVEFDHVEGSPVEATRASLQNLVSRGLGRARST